MLHKLNIDHIYEIAKIKMFPFLRFVININFSMMSSGTHYYSSFFSVFTVGNVGRSLFLSLIYRDTIHNAILSIDTLTMLVIMRLIL